MVESRFRRRIVERERGLGSPAAPCGQDLAREQSVQDDAGHVASPRRWWSHAPGPRQAGHRRLRQRHDAVTTSLHGSRGCADAGPVAATARALVRMRNEMVKFGALEDDEQTFARLGEYLRTI